MWPWWVKIPTEDFTDETLATDDTLGDDVRVGDWGDGHGGWQDGRWGDRHGRLVTLTVMMLKVADELADMLVNMKVDKVADKLVKIPDQDYWCVWQLVILMETMLDVVMGVMDMEVDKGENHNNNINHNIIILAENQYCIRNRATLTIWNIFSYYYY